LQKRSKWCTRVLLPKSKLSIKDCRNLLRNFEMFNIGEVVRGRTSRDLFTVLNVDNDGWVRVINIDWAGWLPAESFSIVNPRPESPKETNFVDIRASESQLANLAAPVVTRTFSYIVTSKSREFFQKTDHFGEAQAYAEEWYTDGYPDVEIHEVTKTIKPALKWE
jgi:hypothetical protein